MTQSFFHDIDVIQYEGSDSNNPLAFKYYDRNRTILGKTMEQHLRFAVCYWHSFCWPGNDVFGSGTFDRPWIDPSDSDLKFAEQKADAAFEFINKLGTPFFTFHDADVAPQGSSMREFSYNLNHMADILASSMERTGIKLLWGTANLFGHRRYCAGASTNPNPEMFACAATQVKQMIDITHRLGGENYVLWGGREGYDTLLNTDIQQELDQYARFLHLVIEYKHKIGFKGSLLIEPKPQEPTKHQYDHDTATVAGFLHEYGLADEIKVNIEANHATLAGHSFEHEISMAFAKGIFGSIDANRGDPQNGWDTDQFPNDIAENTLIMYRILKGGGFTTGGFNFDTKLRRQSIGREDLFYAHIGGMDTLAHSLVNAAKLIESGELQHFVTERYAGWQSDLGQRILNNDIDLEQLAERGIADDLAASPVSGRQELLENIVNKYL